MATPLKNVIKKIHKLTGRALVKASKDSQKPNYNAPSVNDYPMFTRIRDSCYEYDSIIKRGIQPQDSKFIRDHLHLLQIYLNDWTDANPDDWYD